MKQGMGEIVEILVKEGKPMGRILIDDEIVEVPLLLLLDARVGDRVDVDAGIAISVVDAGEPIAE